MNNPARPINGIGLPIHPPAPLPRIALISTSTACAVFVIAALLETWLIALLQPSGGELTWISDLVLAGTLGVVLYLWLHLRFTRAALMLSQGPAAAVPVAGWDDDRTALVLALDGEALSGSLQDARQRNTSGTLQAGSRIAS